MARTSMIIGIALMLAGAMGYSMAHKESVTALIPAFIGMFMALSGLLVANQPTLRCNLMRVNIVLAFLAMGGSASRLPYAMVNPSANPVQLIVLSEVVFLSALFLFLGIQSFIRTRMGQKSIMGAPCSTQD